MYKIIKRLFWILVGQFIGAGAFRLVLVPNQLVAPGFGGVATVLNNLFGFNMQMTLIVLCIPVLLWSFFSYDRKQVFYAAFSYGAFTFGIGIVGKIFDPFITDPIIATVVAGVMLGVATGIILRQEVANGPEAIVGLYLNEKKDLSVGNFFMVLNTVIIFSSVIYGDFTFIVYSLICNMISSRITDYVIIGLNKYYIVNIMSDNYLDITDYIRKELHRRVTFIQGMDTTNVKKKMLIQTVVSNRELVSLKMYVKGLKDDSFVYVTESAGLIGGGFE
ncbi:YitT family protein [Anaerobium acetethylicum]|uniref:Uncharacterized membrane-anchored protein YitT, contains DUF161 and DUF2179 domains n=1 Tax=Anaerobium acetethylicum TaxID=1619234 RepID=A0A1D3TU69_9FIRM|nr:YitT family protein [Anaerobium acetethylicum]SCP97566.1 Uncharacterized membrane-anchored protein YitT, contains DUF161 and DUF2179 domains [Anaerobium acetethylicum]